MIAKLKKYASTLRPAGHKNRGPNPSDHASEEDTDTFQSKAPPRALKPFKPSSEGIQTFLSHQAGVTLRFPRTASEKVDGPWVQATLDYVFTSLPLPAACQKPFITVCSQMMGGLGDLMFGAKTARLITQALPQAKVALLVHPKPDVDLGALEQEYGIESFTELDALTEKHGNPNLMVVGPTRCAAVERLLPDAVDLVRVSEYGRYFFDTAVSRSPRGNSKIERGITSGLGDGESGLLVDPELATWNEHTDRAEAWANLDAPLRDGLLQGRNVEQFEAEAGLYFGYCNRSQEEALMALVTASSQLPKQEINLVLAGSAVSWRSALRHHLTTLAETHKDIQFHTLQPCDTSAPLCIPEQRSARRERTLRIFTDSKMRHTSFVAALSLSEPLRVLTGDQSLTEGISLRNTLPVYEILSWKRQSYSAIIQLARDSHLPDLEEFLQGAMGFQRNWNDLAKRSTDAQLLASARAFHTSICRHHNLAYRLMGAVKAALYTRTYPEIAAVQVGLLNEVEDENVASERVATALSKLHGLAK